MQIVNATAKQLKELTERMSKEISAGIIASQKTHGGAHGTTRFQTIMQLSDTINTLRGEMSQIIETPALEDSIDSLSDVMNTLSNTFDLSRGDRKELTFDLEKAIKQLNLVDADRIKDITERERFIAERERIIEQVRVTQRYTEKGSQRGELFKQFLGQQAGDLFGMVTAALSQNPLLGFGIKAATDWFEMKKSKKREVEAGVEQSRIAEIRAMQQEKADILAGIDGGTPDSPEVVPEEISSMDHGISTNTELLSEFKDIASQIFRVLDNYLPELVKAQEYITREGTGELETYVDQGILLDTPIRDAIGVLEKRLIPLLSTMETFVDSHEEYRDEWKEMTNKIIDELEESGGDLSTLVGIQKEVFEDIEENRRESGFSKDDDIMEGLVKNESKDDGGAMDGLLGLVGDIVMGKSLLGAGKGLGGGLKGMVGKGASVGKGLFGASKMVGGGLLKSTAGRVPILGGLLAGGMTYMDNASAGMSQGQNIGEAIGSGGGTMAGAASGAMLGASIGSIIPGIGTMIGGVAGSILGGMAGSELGQNIGGWIGNLFDDNELSKNKSQDLTVDTNNIIINEALVVKNNRDRVIDEMQVMDEIKKEMNINGGNQVTNTIIDNSRVQRSVMNVGSITPATTPINESYRTRDTW